MKMVRHGIGFALLFVSMLFASGADGPESPLPLTCPAGAPLGAIDLRVRSPQNKETLPLQTVNRLSEGDTVLYSPVLRGGEKRPGEVALVLVDANRKADSDGLIVLDPGRANESQEWKIPSTVSLAVFVYGPQGLNKKKVRGFLAQDDQLVAQLADYAEKTSQTEALLQTLADNAASSASMNAALNGFASQYGLAVQIDKNAAPAAQAQMLFATMNPQLASYNPIAAGSTAQRVGQTASVAAAAATLFFGSPIGLAAGGTAMLLDLRAIAFPGTQFRSSFTQPALRGLHLCGQRGTMPPHTRAAYVWALRIPNTGSPSLQIGTANYLPVGQKTVVPVETSPRDWKYLQRARNWALEGAPGKRVPLKVLKIGNEQEIEVDLQSSKVDPGDYRLTASWDWTLFQAAGFLHVRPLSDFKDTRLTVASQNALVAHGGKVPITLTGNDFEFTTKVEIQKAADEFATPEPLRFILPKGLRRGEQRSLDVQIDTGSLTPGDYSLLISQQDGVRHAIDLHVLPNLPRVDNLPIPVNQGVTAQHYVLKGERLNLLSGLLAPNISFELGKASANGAEREVTVHLSAGLEPGQLLPLQARLNDRSQDLEMPQALQIVGPLPAIVSSQLSLPADMGVALRGNEFPAGSTLIALLDVRNIGVKSTVDLGCAGDAGERPTLRIGAQDKNFSLQRLSTDELFLSYDTSGLPAGCNLEAVIDNGRDGRSAPYALAKLIRLPNILSIAPLDTAAPVGLHAFRLTGDNLEMIGQVGWDQSAGIDVPGLPSAIPGMGQRQAETVYLSDPPPTSAAPLFIWLRGESQSRATKVIEPVATTAGANQFSRQ